MQDLVNHALDNQLETLNPLKYTNSISVESQIYFAGHLSKNSMLLVELPVASEA